MNTSQLCQPTIQPSRRASRRQTNGLNRSPSYAGCLRAGLSARAGTCGKSERMPLRPKASQIKAMQQQVSLGLKCWGDGWLVPPT